MSNDQNKSAAPKDAQKDALDQKSTGMNPTAPKIADPPAGDPSKTAPKTDVVGNASSPQKKS